MDIDITDLVRDYLIRYTEWLWDNDPEISEPEQLPPLVDEFLKETL